MPLSKRYVYDGDPSVALDAIQRRAREGLIEDLNSGRISLRENRCLCGQGPKGAFAIAEKDFHGLPLNLYLCRHCSLIYASPYMDELSSGIFYRQYYRDLYEGERTAGLQEIFDTRYREGGGILSFIESAVSPKKGGRVLEIGCSTGGQLKVFADASYDVTGIDLDERYLQFGRQRGLRLINSTFEDFARTSGEKFDLVVMSHVIEHMQGPPEALMLLRDMLGEGGCVFIEVPNIDLSYIEPAQFQFAHKWYFDTVTLSDLLERAGFRPVAVDKRAHLRMVGRKDAVPASAPAPSRADYARKKYRRGRWFERMLPLLALIRFLRIGTPVKYVYYKFFVKK